jgi:cytochrome c oxidase cbb3-type subunit 4
MNPIWGDIIGVVTVVLMLTFIGIWIWAWRKRHRANFKRMSLLPLEDSPAAAPDDATPSTKEQQ